MATFQPNKPINNTRATSLIIGAAIRKEKVTPRGIPASTKPKKRGIAEQEQKGVTMPKVEAIILPVNRDLPSSDLRVLSAEKYDLIIPTIKTISTRSNITLGTSKTKNQMDSVKCVPFSKPIKL